MDYRSHDDRNFDMATYKLNVAIWKLDRCIKQRRHYDPLAVAWLACAQIASSQKVHAKELFGEIASWDVYEIMTGYVVCKIDACMTGVTLGMWDQSCGLTNVWINRVATYAFLCLRQICCRDVAGLIARMVARMYLDDIQWLASLSPTKGYISYENTLRDVPLKQAEQMIRERIAKWLPV